MIRRTEAIQLRKRLKAQMNRANRLAIKCENMVRDETLPLHDRETAEKRGNLAIETRKQLQRTLSAINEALDG